MVTTFPGNANYETVIEAAVP